MLACFSLLPLGSYIHGRPASQNFPPAAMSSDEDYDFHRGKKRRVQRACDVCRRRKSDGSQVSGDKCTTCTDANLDCTYLETVKRPPPKSYVDSLEARLERSETIISQLRSELAAAHFRSTSASTPTTSTTSTVSISSPHSETGGATARRAASLLILRTALQNLNEPTPPPYGDDLVHVDIAADFKRLKVDVPQSERRFIGKSSGATLIMAAIDLREDVKREEREDALSWTNGMSNGTGHPPEGSGDSSQDGSGGGGGEEEGAWKSRRTRFWTFRPWQNTAPRTHSFNFPAAALMVELVDLYFTHQNIYVPLLHRPTFERCIAEGLHLRDNGFGATVLLVCAVGSRWSTDPRVIPTTVRGRHGETDGLACGKEWFDQVPLVGNHMFGHATLYDLQYYCLAVQFLMEGSAPQACWTLIGVGLRLAQDIGAHRRSAHVEVPSVEGELFKRAFWALVYMDRIVSCGLGRPCAMQYDDFDLDLPINCNDEYWEHPVHPFQQPPSVPSQILYFNAILRLNNLLAACLKLLYSLSKVRAVFSMHDAEENIVAELDSALNKWRDQVPEHLRWDPERADPLFFDQSVALYCSYNWLQILIHRPFIPMVRKSAPTALPSLAICTSAARACANMLDIQRQRKGNVAVMVNLPAAFSSGIILLLNVWSEKRTGLVPDPSREMANVHKCMEVLRLCEDRWQGAGFGWDILAELASVGQLPLPYLKTPGSTETKTEDHRKGKRAATGDRYSTYHVAIPEDNARILLGSRGLHQAFDRPIHDSQFQTPYAPMPQPASFAGGIRGASGTFGPGPMEPSAFAPAPAPETLSPPEDPFAMIHADPAQASRELGEMMHLIDRDTIAMWTSAPNGYEVDDWGNYLNDFNEITQGQYPS
ncbi:fungal-specific transcription factor domain-containing protein [Mycena metata]|uniref:Fungal-specific transcription factor domain-containing protein n=1 Tax=Mycena metata TaxID=1033252 RepID=A0AAD7J6T7_9AGAR|nr:fungal-specific transcription factor domain-containing protein [Mycena metata]